MRCKPGDQAIVECGAFGADSPNVGLVVTCVTLDNPPHSVHGPIWNVTTPGPREIVTEFGATGLQGQMADEWLRPLPPKRPDAANDPVYAPKDEVEA